MLLVAGVFAAVRIMRSRHAPLDGALREDLERFGLWVGQSGMHTEPSASGTVDGHNVNVEFDGNGPRCSIEHFGLALDIFPRVHPLPGRRGGRLPITGDDSFDFVYEINGDPWALAAALSAKMRTELVMLSGWMGEGSLRVSFSRSNATTLSEMLERSLALVKEIELRADEIPIRLLRAFHEEPVEGARLVQLELLLRLDDNEPAKQQALDMVLSDRTRSEERLLAARSIGAAGHDAIRELAFAPELPGETRARAIQALPRHLLDLAHIRAWKDHPVPVMRTVVAEKLALYEPRDEAEREAVEAMLIDFLADFDVEVKIAAIVALERVGSVAAVERLLEIAALLAPARIKHASNSAVRAIQARAVDAGQGGLSLAAESDQTGALSHAEAAAGALSIDKN